MGAVGVAGHPGGGWHDGRFQAAGLADPGFGSGAPDRDMHHSGAASSNGRGWLAARLDAPVRLPDAAWWSVAALLALVLGLSRWPILDIAALAALGLVFFIRPDVSLPLIAFSIPLWPRPKALIGLEFSLYEILLWLAIAGAMARWLVSRAGDSCAATTAPPVTRSRLAGSRASRRWIGGDVGRRAIECGRA